MKTSALEVESAEEKSGLLRWNIFSDLCCFARGFWYKSD
jgi:hypothetical protein